MDTTLVPAYGRDYASMDAVLLDWEAGKDFVIVNVNSCWFGKYSSIRDYRQGDTITFRYAKLSESFTYQMS